MQIYKKIALAIVIVLSLIGVLQTFEVIKLSKYEINYNNCMKTVLENNESLLATIIEDKTNNPIDVRKRSVLEEQYHLIMKDLNNNFRNYMETGSYEEREKLTLQLIQLWYKRKMIESQVNSGCDEQYKAHFKKLDEFHGYDEVLNKVNSAIVCRPKYDILLHEIINYILYLMIAIIILSITVIIKE